MTKVLPRPRSIVAGIIAGIVGAVLISAALVYGYANLLHTPNFSLAGFMAFDAAVLLGKGAFANPAAPFIGLVLHVLVSVGWALGYAVTAERQPQLLARPITSGATFGFIIYFAMQMVLVAANAYHQPTPREAGLAIVAHIVFFGVPVALVIARLMRAR